MFMILSFLVQELRKSESANIRGSTHNLHFWSTCDSKPSVFKLGYDSFLIALIYNPLQEEFT